MVVFGGRISSVLTAKVEVVNLRKPSSTCTSLPDYPLYVGNPRSVLMKNGTLLACGGLNITIFKSDCFLLLSGNWVQIASMNTPKHTFQMAIPPFNNQSLLAMSLGTH